MARRMPIWMLLTLASCDCGSGSLRVEGDHPYVRCLAYEAEDRTIESIGGVVEDQTLSLQNVESVEFFAVRASSAEWLAEHESTALQVVLGGFARDEGSALPLLRALAARGPALLILGGEDDVEIFEEALDEAEAPNLVSLLGIRRVDFGSAAMVVVHGAPSGRYARGDSACGFSPEDLEGLNPETGDLLVSWAAPRGQGDEGLFGQPIGDEALAEMADSSSLTGGVYAWPRQSAGAQDTQSGHFVVSALGGLQVRADGARFLGTPLTWQIGDGAWSPGSR